MPATANSPAWESPEYRTITRASFVDGNVEVDFADGAHASVPVDRLVPPGSHTVDWTGMRAGDHEIFVPRKDDSDLEISWMDLRSQEDPALAGFLIETAEEEAGRVGARLRALRESRGLTAKEVADRAGIAPMSLSRIELGRHDVVYRTLRKVLAAMGLGLEDLVDPPASFSVESLTKGLVKAGVTKSLAQRMSDALGGHSERLADAVERIFHWDAEQLVDGAELKIDTVPAALGHFKSAINQDPALATYTLWAYWLALLVDQAVPRKPTEIPENPYAIREDILARTGSLRFEDLLSWCWEQNVAVLPLRDPGEFHGAVWVIQGRAVIVLKQGTPWESRWTFDLAHEMGHLARHVDENSPSVVEVGEIRPVSDDEDDEQEASDFAGELLLGDPDRLAQELVARTERSLPRLKQEVKRLASESGVEVDALANYMAWRLAGEGENWWSTAAGLQDESGQAPVLALQMLRDRIDWSLLDDDDAALLSGALDWEAET